MVDQLRRANEEKNSEILRMKHSQASSPWEIDKACLDYERNHFGIPTISLGNGGSGEVFQAK
jgi:hypothetical protein